MEVEQDADVVSTFDHAPGLFEHDFGNLHMAVGGLVKRGGDDLRIDTPLHVGDFLRTFVDEQDDQVDLWVVEADGVRHILQQGGLSRLGLGNNHATLALSNGGEEVHQSRADRAP